MTYRYNVFSGTLNPTQSINQSSELSERLGIGDITRMWANAKRDGRPAEYSWRPLFNAAKFG